MIFQEYNLVDRLTVMENLLSGRLGYVSFWKAYRRKFPSEDIAAAFQLLDRVGLEGYQDTRATNMFARMLPPDFSRWSLLIRGLLESVQMALAASFFGMLLAIPLGLCGASNLVPKPVYLVARTLIILSRTFHEIIIAILFVKIFGFGPLAGVLTLLVASTSFISKMLAEDIENMPPGHLEAVRATGASFPKLLVYCISPQVLPVIYGTTVYRWDINIRESTVLGFVGAGGIGILLYSSINQFLWQEVALILLSVFGVVIVSEFVSAAVRKRIS